MGQTVSVVDVGSNSVRLMTARAEGTFIEPLDTELVTTRLIFGMRDGFLTDAAMERTARAAADFVQKAKATGAQNIHIFGTCAMRDAANSGVLNDRMEKLCGLRARVLSGEEEAALACAGAAPEGRCGVIDIGGGSTELICGENGRALCAVSAPVGAVRLMDRLGAGAPSDAMMDAAQGIISPFAAEAARCHMRRWVGVGGTITALAAMDLRLGAYSPEAIEGHAVTLEGAGSWLADLCAMTLEQRRQIPGLSPKRAEIMPFGAAILCAAMRALGVEAVYASDRDNREGYIRRYML